MLACSTALPGCLLTVLVALCHTFYLCDVTDIIISLVAPVDVWGGLIWHLFYLYRLNFHMCKGLLIFLSLVLHFGIALNPTEDVSQTLLKLSNPNHPSLSWHTFLLSLPQQLGNDLASPPSPKPVRHSNLSLAVSQRFFPLTVVL